MSPTTNNRAEKTTHRNGQLPESARSEINGRLPEIVNDEPGTIEATVHQKEPKLRAGSSRNEKISQLIADVLQNHLGVTVSQYVALSSLTRSQLLTVMKPVSLRTVRSGGSDPVFSALIRDWENLKQSGSSDALTVAQDKLIKLLVSRESSPTLRLLRTWRLQHSDNFDTQWGDQYKVFRKGHHHKAFSLNVPEMIAIAQKIGIVPSEIGGAELWKHPVVQDIRRCYRQEVDSRGGARSSGELIALLDFAGFHTSAEGMMKSSQLVLEGLNWDTARALYRFDPVPYQSVEQIIGWLADQGHCSKTYAKALGERFQKDHESSVNADSFQSRVIEGLHAQGIGYGDVARAMNLEKKSKIAGSKSSLVRFTVEKGAHLSACAPAAVALFAATTREDFEKLVALKRAEIVRTYGMQRSSPPPHPLKVERTLWGVSASRLQFPQDKIKNTEWHRRTGKLTADEVESAVAQSQTIGLRNALTAWNRLLSERQISTIPGTIKGLASLNGGLEFVRSAAGVALDRAGRYLDGSELPTYPHVERLYLGAGLTPPPTVFRRWQFEFAERESRSLSPLGRALNTEILADSRDATNFVVQHGFSKSLASLFRRTVALGVSTPETIVILAAKMGHKANSLRTRLLLSINQDQDVVKGAIRWLGEMKDGERKAVHRSLLALDRLLRYDPAADGSRGKARNMSLDRVFAAKTTPPYSQDSAIPESLRAREAKIGKVLPMIAGITRAELHRIVDHIRGENIETVRSSAIDRDVFARLKTRSITPRSLAPVMTQLSAGGARSGLHSAVEFALRNEHVTQCTPFGVLAAFAASDLDDFNRLLSSKRGEIVSLYPDMDTLALEAKLWGFDLRLGRERAMRGGASGRSEAEVVEKIGEIQARALELCTGSLRTYLGRPAPVTTAKIIQACLERTDSNVTDFARIARIKASRVTSYIEGINLPDLVTYQKLLAAGGIPFTPAMEARWQLDYALVKSRSPLYADNPLGAAIDTIIAREGRYIEPILSAKGGEPAMMRVINRLKSGAGSFDDLESFCKTWKISSRSPAFHFLHLLLETGSADMALDQAITMIAENNDARRSKSVLFELKTFLDRDYSVAVNKPGAEDFEGQIRAVGEHARILSGEEMRAVDSGRLLDAVSYFPGASRPAIRRVLTANQAFAAELNKADPATRTELIREWEAEIRKNGGAPHETQHALLESLPIELLGEIVRGTDAIAGTERKLEIVSYRLQLSLPLWHEQDSKLVMPNTASERERAAFLFAQGQSVPETEEGEEED